MSIYESRLSNLAFVIVLLSGAIMALTFIGSRAPLERLSGVILRETIGTVVVAAELDREHLAFHFGNA